MGKSDESLQTLFFQMDGHRIRKEESYNVPLPYLWKRVKMVANTETEGSLNVQTTIPNFEPLIG
ncbi:hypothetical protein [Fervidibacillus albus]|uniref:Uncharacterized protein n=1 Tax=Fervidibacillus albus TaxID=2980026 RepID=A0A9E8RXN4_9BACI|nr:hypothetical protein [Fervidibacillus albus]WAA09752.1 hypothetical protein OE104_14770 [Fervidibacillus albus]